jgi:hypothetical protein
MSVNSNDETLFYDEEVPPCKPHNNARMSTTHARSNKNVNEKDSEPGKSVVTGSVRRHGI